jgi:2-oxoacid:acceptor oxidoreductase delta subunit (pyruvate/2-ketoisovalerate family)
MEAGQLILEIMGETNNSTTRPTGEYENIQADVLVQAVGQTTDATLLNGLADVNWQDGRLQVNNEMSTGIDGVFAGGDLIPTGGNVTTAIGHGKKAARNINAWLSNQCYVPAVKSEAAKFEYLETWYYTDAPRTHRPILDVVRRTSGFAEVVGNLDEETAAYEARRCMSCGNCFECDNCYGVCPDNAVKKLGAGLGFEFDYDYCKGCGVCVTECPCGAIKMVPESI